MNLKVARYGLLNGNEKKEQYKEDVCGLGILIWSLFSLIPSPLFVTK
jgi:hypothetical protein